jgi:hypothetical protein
VSKSPFHFGSLLVTHANASSLIAPLNGAPVRMALIMRNGPAGVVVGMELVPMV